MNELLKKYEDIINKDYGLYVDIINSVESNLSDTIYVDDSTLLIKTKNTNPTYMLLSRNSSSKIKILDKYDIKAVLVRDDKILDYFTKIGFKYTPCYQYYYDGPKFEINKELVFRKPDLTDLDIIKETYGYQEEIPISYKENRLFGCYKDNKIIGYVGKHNEDACGMLHVFNEYRNKGYGSEIEKYIINYQLDNNRIPFFHVIIDNTKSINLQSKLNIKRSLSKIYWMWNEN